MDLPDRHPKTGRRYIHVIGTDVARFAQTFSEVAACYRKASETLPWMRVIDVAAFKAMENGPLWNDPTVVFLLWHDMPVPKKEDRQCIAALHYCETIGNPGSLHGFQAEYWAAFVEKARNYDLVLVHTPKEVERVAPFCAKAAAAPIGYEPSVMGTPDWSPAKEHDIGWYGARAGRRHKIISDLGAHFGFRFRDIGGRYDHERKCRLDLVRISLLIHHSLDASFPTLRLWQTIATSSALVTEEGDAWPAVLGRHYLAIPRVDPERIIETVEAIDGILKSGDAEAVARRAHEELAGYTPARCMEEFVVPAIEG